MDALHALGVNVAGCSCDTLETLSGFVQSHELRYPMLSDPDGALARAFGVFNSDRSRARRVTFVIAQDSTIQTCYDPVALPRHAEQVVIDLQGT